MDKIMKKITYCTTKPITPETDTYIVYYELPNSISAEPIVLHNRGYVDLNTAEKISFSEFDQNKNYEFTREFKPSEIYADEYVNLLELAGYKPKFSFSRNNLNDSTMSANNPSADWENKIVDMIINSDEELKIQAAATQLMLHDRVKAALEEPYFTALGRRLEDIDWHLPKYSYVKNVERNGKKYLLTIDYKTLRVSFNLQEE